MTPNRERDAREMAATMDHSDIRGLATAFHLFLAGLPRSRDWDHHKDARIKLVEGSPHRSRASRCRFGVELSGECGPVSHLQDRGMKALRSGANFHLSSDIPNEACELTSNCDTAFVLSHLAPCIQFSESICQAQLRLPGDIAYGFGLTFLAHFDGAAHPRVEAVGPGCFDENSFRGRRAHGAATWL